ncbi:peptide/nickel transport system ATP-binding protein/oligopeptide transport system ATP-binding protein [Salinibacillus kushneri]|uniref:Peptide/nickel transport system ATP-binding protein/oligopeptide transport system ATP-binding protein n=1 Tax=Salinibacillus kushneri TaxID=237682 RepID=A0A1I0DVZ8_9BACI|nr:ABC transporter ATP-binding protein [Salinibacillus kushneri]SET36041.1 peptide/nickel transport system ATP-binding protein/oligopeptide transport system ATP-binding protein [Salinibacillus kushneri]
MEQLLDVQNLKIQFRTGEGKLSPVRDISFQVHKGETLCIVGESGCGKSITSLSLMGLLPANGEIAEESFIKLDSDELTGKSQDELRKLRGNRMSMIFQEPMTALNPVFTVGYQLREPLYIHQKLSRKEANQKAVELLDKVGIPDPKKRVKQYPHELSGGMRQRVMIAMALACKPSLLIADEPTTALDVTIQAQILDLIEDLKQEMDMGIIFVTHDMGVVAEIADRVMVMYAGEVVEIGEVEEIFNHPKHPYTQGLLASVPNVEDDEHTLESIPGTLPNVNEKIEGCRFHPRCPLATEQCRKQAPPIFHVNENHTSKCWLQEEANINDKSTTTS